MAAGELQSAGGGAADMDRHSPPPQHAKMAATFGFTPAQQIMFQSSNMNGQRVVMVTPEVARSLGIAPGADGDSGTAIRIQEDSGDVSVSVLETEQDGMIDPDQFLAMELASGKAEAVVDDELTSLSWLHSKNILKPSDVKFRAGAGQGEMVLDAAPEGELEEAEPRGPMSTAPLLVEETAVSEFNSEESPTSDYLEELPEAPAPRPPGGAGRTAAVAEIGRHGDGRSPPPNMIFNFGKAKRHPPHLPYDPKVHVHFKPPFSFSCLIFMSIEDSPQKAMPVKEIYNWVQEHFPFYQAAPLGWKNSVRHNLSLNKCFRKIEKSPGPGKGSLWTVDPAFRPHLIQALKRSPCVQETPVGASPPYRPWTAAATALGGHHLPSSGSPRRTPARRPPPPPPVPGSAPAPGHTPGPGGDLRSTESLEEAAMAAVMTQSPSAPAGVPRLTPRRRPGRGGRGRPPGGQPRSQSDDGGPDPQLFPLLSRRLLSGSGDGAPSPAGRQGSAAASPATDPSATVPAGAAPATPATPAAAAEGDDETTDGERPLMIVQEPPPPSPAPSSDTSSAQARCKVKVVKRPRDQLDYHPVLVSTSRHGHGEPGTSGPSLTAATTAAMAAKRQLVIIRRSPEEEHTYAVDPPQRQRPRLIHQHQQHQQHQHLQEHQYQHHYPASVTMLLSDDEAFSDDSNLSAHEMISVGRTAPGGGNRLSPEEAGRRFVREGADLLLNLAGVAVSGAAPTAPHARGHLTTARGSLTSARGQFTTGRGSLTSARGQFTGARGQFTGARGQFTGARGPLTTRTVIVRRGVGRPPGSRGRGRGSLSAAVSAIFR